MPASATASATASTIAAFASIPRLRRVDADVRGHRPDLVADEPRAKRLVGR